MKVVQNQTGALTACITVICAAWQSTMIKETAICKAGMPYFVSFRIGRNCGSAPGPSCWPKPEAIVRAFSRACATAPRESFALWSGVRLVAFPFIRWEGMVQIVKLLAGREANFPLAQALC